MANADFNPKQNANPGGFDNTSYRETERPEAEAVRLTPLQKKLAALEEKLPPALAQKGMALVLSIAVMLAAFVGQIFFMLRGGKNSRIVLVKFAFLVLLLSELGRNLDGGGAFLVGIYAAVAVLMGSMTGWVVGVLIEGGRKRRK